MSRALGWAVGTVVSPVLEYIDVDGVVCRVDVDALYDRVDLNHHLDRVDFNHHLDRVDVDRLMQRVDVNALLEKADISTIVARSSTGVYGMFLDPLRKQLVWLDQHLQRLGRCDLCRTQVPLLAPAPGSQARPPWPIDEDDLAVDMQGRCAGLVVRAVAAIVDEILVLFSSAIVFTFVETLAGVLLLDEEWTFPKTAAQIFLPTWHFVYTAFGLVFTGRTLGMAFSGIFLVNHADGKRAGALQALFRILVMFILFPVIIATLWIGWIRADGRQLPDFFACTDIVYLWDARMAKVREEAITFDLERGESKKLTNEIDSPVLPN